MIGIFNRNHDELYSKVYADELLLKSWKKVRSNKGRSGIDGVTIPDFEKSLEKNLTSIRASLRTRTYRFSPVIRFRIHLSCGKEREISLLTVSDKIVQTAVLEVISPLVEHSLSSSCFSFRKGIGIENAVRAITTARRNEYVWGVKADIRKFFDSINRELLSEYVQSCITDKNIFYLIYESIHAPSVDMNQKSLEVNRGIPQGAILSPALSNLYLTSFDRALVRTKECRLVRYCDDFLIFCRSPSRARKALVESEEFLVKLELRLKEPSVRFIDFVKGFRFLGYQFKGTTITLSH